MCTKYGNLAKRCVKGICAHYIVPFLTDLENKKPSSEYM